MRVRSSFAGFLILAAMCGPGGSGVASAQQGGIPQARPLAAPRARPDWGTTPLTYVQVAGATFVPQNSTGDFDTTSPESGQVLRTGQPLGMRMAAPIQMPDGALISYLELDYCDNSGPGQRVSGKLVISDYTGHYLGQIGDLLSNGLGCYSSYVDASGSNWVVDNFNYHYWLAADVDYDPSYKIGLAGMIVGYKLQVSPAPAQATFNDVPTSHPFFQFIEALAAADITGGCGGGKYCPDSPVTRGQMAVFLAKALGLNWN